MTLVSKNGLSFTDLFAIEFEIRREEPLHLTELLEPPIFQPVTGHFEVAFTRDGNLDFVPLFERERFDNHSRKTHSQNNTYRIEDRSGVTVGRLTASAPSGRIWSGVRESNPCKSAWKADARPLGQPRFPQT